LFPHHVNPKIIFKNVVSTNIIKKTQEVDMDKKELHELLARKNALDIALRQSLPDVIEHLEAVVGALLASQDTQTMNRFESELKVIEQITPEAMSIVKLHSEDGDSATPSKRQQWRKERNELQAKLEKAEAMGYFDILED